MNAFELHVHRPFLRTMQIIAVALPVGATVFLAITTGVTLFNNQQIVMELDVMEYFLMAAAVTALPASMIVPSIVNQMTAKETFKGIDLEKEIEEENSPNRETDKKRQKKLLEIYQTGMIIGSAMVEGVAILGGIIVLIDQSAWGLGIGAFAILVLFLRIPSEYRVQNQMQRMIQACSESR